MGDRSRRGTAARSEVIRKGGDPVLPALSPEVVDQVAQGCVAIAELLGDLPEGSSLDEISAERLVAAVQRGGRLEKEAEEA